jgi:hypothetical protein
MDHINILKRAWQILLGFKALWLFGFLLALSTSSAGWTLLLSSNQERYGGARLSFTLPDGTIFTIPGENQLYWEHGIPDEVLQAFITIGITLLCLGAALVVIRLLFRYISETALVRMVADHEQTGEYCKVGQGFRFAFSRYAVRFFLIDLVIVLLAALVFILLFACAIAPFFLWMTDVVALGVIGTVAGIGLFFMVVFLAIIAGVALGLLRDFCKRACALEDLGVFASIGRGYVLIRQHLTDVGLMWLLMFGIRIGWPVLMFPVMLLLFGIGGLIAAGGGMLVNLLAELLFTGNVPIILAFIAGAVVIMVVVGFPLAFLTGLRDSYISSTWTLTYRDLLALESLENGWLPDLEDQGA